LTWIVVERRKDVEFLEVKQQVFNCLIRVVKLQKINKKLGLRLVSSQGSVFAVII